MRQITCLIGSFVVCLMACEASFAGPPESRTTARRIDQMLANEVGVDSTQWAGPVSDEIFLRRAFFDLVGEPPTIEDVLAFALDDQPDKRQRLIEQLLDDESYGENWARYWRDVILYRRSEERALVVSNSLEEYLSTALNGGRSWDEIAREFVMASGDARENGATAIIVAQNGRPEETVAEISRILCGIQIQCAQCHDHPSDSWTREQFHELAAFFPRVAVRPDGQGAERTLLVTVTDAQRNFGRRNNNNRFRGTPEHRMPDLDRPEQPGKLMEPVFYVTDQRVPAGTKDRTRRGALAHWLTSSDNPWFAKAFVNRIWAELVGSGFYATIDDMGPERDVTAPETLEFISQQFVESGYDHKWLFATIMSTDAYQRPSRGKLSSLEIPFSYTRAQRLRADQLYASVAHVLDLQMDQGQAAQGGYGRGRGPRALFNTVFGFDPSDERDDLSGSIPQVLTLMNSPQISLAMSARPGTALSRMMAEYPENEALITAMYMKTLSRQPTSQEVKDCMTIFRQVPQRTIASEDLLWSLMNCTEFLVRR